jgi:hypothetical protein
MKKVVLVGTYCDTPNKLDSLIDLIKKIKEKNLDIIVYGKYPIPEYVQNMCDYWIYDKSNPLINGRILNVWEHGYGKKFNKLINFDWGFAVMDQMIKSLGFAKSLNYDVAYWLNYDVNLENFDFFENQCDDLLKSVSSVFYYWDTPHSTIGVSLLSICFKIQESYEKLKGVVNMTVYNKLINDSEYIAEDVFGEMLIMSELSHYIIRDNYRIDARINSFGDRINGDIPKHLTKTPHYINKCFVGFDTDKNNPIIYISNEFVNISEIVFDIGHDDLLIISNPEVNIFNCIEIDLKDKTPNKLKLISINGEEINEVLDEDLDGRYYECNVISNL